jgi:A/G-specific adenine glycosylase
MLKSPQIASRLLAWWDTGHADYPWRRNRDPYAIWVAEIMLQQTQVLTVIPYYERWLGEFPTIQTLAKASLDEVLRVWQGLGYYSRARNMHAAAQTLVTDFDGRLPQSVSELMKLKGIGRYTAGAIASIAFDQQVPVLDGNVIRILTRLTDLSENITRSATRKHLWELAADLVPAHRAGDFNQALMELGQQVCSPAQPRCLLCPLTADCLARLRGTQLERPVRPPRKNIPHYDVVAGVIWEKDSSTKPASSRFLIARRPLDGLLGGLWEFPGGKQELDETLSQALRREIKEELDIDIEVGRPLARVKHAYTHFRITLHAFHAVHVDGRPRNLSVMDHVWVSLDELDKYAFALTDRKIISHLWEELQRHEGNRWF